MKKLLSICLLLALSLSLFAGCETLPPVEENTSASTTTSHDTTTPPPVDRDTIINPEKYTELELKARQIVWDTIKDTTTQYNTINALNIGYIYEFGDALVCITGLHPGNCDCLPSPDRYLPVLGHILKHPQGLDWEVYYKGNVYSLEDAYHKGIITEENFLTIGKDYFIDLSLDDKNLLTSHILKDSLATSRFTPDNAETTNIASLFDGIKTQEEWEANGTGQLSGTITYNACFLFDLDAPAKITAYTVTTGSGAGDYDTTMPLGWMLYGTNDAEAAAAMRTEGATIESLQDSGKWTSLAFTWDSGMKAENFSENIYAIEKENQGEYQYYCWCVEYTGGIRLQVAELELYTD